MIKLSPAYPFLKQTRFSYSGWIVYTLLMFACLTNPTLSTAQNSLEQILIQPATNLPGDFTSDIDILFVYDGDLLNQLPFTQFEWVSSRDQYLNQASDLLELTQFHVISTSDPQRHTLSERQRNAHSVLVFASHEDPVAEAIDISFETRILLQIESYGINVIQTENNK